MTRLVMVWVNGIMRGELASPFTSLGVEKEGVWLAAVAGE